MITLALSLANLHDYVVGAPLPTGATARDLAWRLGISRSRASELLGDLPGSAVRRESDPRTGEARWSARSPASPEATRDAWRRFLGACRRRSRGARSPSRPLRVADQVAAAHAALAAGDGATLRRLLADRLLDAAAVRRGVPPRWRDLLTVEVLHLRADAAMQTGAAREAVRLASRALELAREPARQVALLGIQGAALRMISPASAEAAIEVYGLGLASARVVSGDAGRAWRRLLHGELVAPLLVVGDRTRAEREASASADLVAATGAEWAQSALRRVQLLALGGAHDRARLLFEEVASFPGLPRWLAGWVTRIEPAFLGMDLPRDRWNQATAAAWAGNSGFGFQERLILARIAASPARFQPDSWPSERVADVLRFATAEHIARHGLRPSDCPRCRGRSLPERAAHALGGVPGVLLPLLAT